MSNVCLRLTFETGRPLSDAEAQYISESLPSIMAALTASLSEVRAYIEDVLLMPLGIAVVDCRAEIDADVADNPQLH